MSSAVKHQKVTPCLWFDGDAEEAANFYISLLPNSRIECIVRSQSDLPGGRVGDVLVMHFTLGGSSFMALNGGPYFKFNEAVSLQVACADQAEIDRLTAALSTVPEAEQCGWVKDRYGLSWQIVPTRLHELMSDPDPDRARRTTEAMLQMKKLNIAALERAAAG